MCGVSKLNKSLEAKQFLGPDDLVEMPLSAATIQSVLKGWDAWLDKDPKLSAMRQINLGDWLLKSHRRSVKKVIKHVTRLTPGPYGRQVIDHVIDRIAKLDLDMVPPLKSLQKTFRPKPSKTEMKTINWRLKAHRAMHMVEGLEKASPQPNSIYRLATRLLTPQFRRPGFGYACQSVRRAIWYLQGNKGTYSHYSVKDVRPSQRDSCAPFTKKFHKITAGGMKTQLNTATRVTIPNLERLFRAEESKIV